MAHRVFWPYILGHLADHDAELDFVIVLLLRRQFREGNVISRSGDARRGFEKKAQDGRTGRLLRRIGGVLQAEASDRRHVARRERRQQAIHRERFAALRRGRLCFERMRDQARRDL